MNNYEKLLSLYEFKEGEIDISDEFTLYTGLANKKTKKDYFFELQSKYFSLGSIVNLDMSLKEMAEKVTDIFAQAAEQWLDGYSYLEEFDNTFLKFKIFQEMIDAEAIKEEFV